MLNTGLFFRSVSIIEMTGNKVPGGGQKNNSHGNSVILLTNSIDNDISIIEYRYE